MVAVFDRSRSGLGRSTPADWAKYRVVILGDVLPAQLPVERQKQLEDYATKGKAKKKS